MTVGLIALVYCLHPRGGDRFGVSAVHWVLGIGVTLGVVAVVALGRGTHGNGRAALYGIATGISFGLTASLVAVMSTAASHGFINIFTTWQTYGMIGHRPAGRVPAPERAPGRAAGGRAAGVYAR